MSFFDDEPDEPTRVTRPARPRRASAGGDGAAAPAPDIARRRQLALFVGARDPARSSSCSSWFKGCFDDARTRTR